MTSLDATFRYAAALCRSAELDTLQTIIQEELPEWPEAVRSGSSEERLSLHHAGRSHLREIVRMVATSRGVDYAQLVAAYGRPPFEREAGSAEIVGRPRSIRISVTVDDFLTFASGSERGWGNTISIQLRTDRVGGEPAARWLIRVFDRLCSETAPVYANALATDEWKAQNIDTSRGVEAIGVDLTRSLPGLYWLNYFGPAYVPLFSQDVSGARASITPFAGGVRIQIAVDPGTWTSCEYQKAAARTRCELGEDLFFDRRAPTRPTRAPDLDRLFGTGRIEYGGATAVLARPLADRLGLTPSGR